MDKQERQLRRARLVAAHKKTNRIFSGMYKFHKLLEQADEDTREQLEAEFTKIAARRHVNAYHA